MVNTVTGSVLWYTALFGVQDFVKTQALMPDSIAISDGGANGGGFATVGGGTYPNGPVGRNVGHFQINDDFSWTKGTHTFKAGVNARYDQYTYTSIASERLPGRLQPGRFVGLRQRQAQRHRKRPQQLHPVVPALRRAAFPVSRRPTSTSPTNGPSPRI